MSSVIRNPGDEEDAVVASLTALSLCVTRNMSLELAGYYVGALAG
jgi:hypothetical protein